MLTDKITLFEGEHIEDLQKFDSDTFVNALFNVEKEG